MDSKIVSVIDSQRQQFDAVSTIKAIEFEREKGFAVQLLLANSFLYSVALKNQISLAKAIVNVSAIGISLNPATKLAFLVPRKGAVCLDISYLGMMDIAQQSGAIRWGQAIIVRENDSFELSEIDKPPLHKYNPFAQDRGEIIGAYVVVKTDTGDYLTNAMPISKIFNIRDRSEAWKAYKAKGTLCPWATDEEEMIKKTVVKNASKYWPRRERLDLMIHHMNIEGGEGLAAETAMDAVVMITDQQRSTITDLVNSKNGDFDSLYQWFSQKIDRPITSLDDLTEADADRVIAALTKPKEK